MLKKVLSTNSYLAVFFLLVLLIACQPKPQEQNPTPAPDATAIDPPPPPTPAPTPPPQANCLTEEGAMQAFLTAFAKDIEAKQIMYKSEELSDCSGMFLRVCQATSEKCSDTIFPQASEIRDTRMLGNWFAGKDNFTIIENPLDHSDLIRPGAVMFYGHQGKSYPNATLADLIAEDGIEHMGVVTEVVKNEEGIVMSYQLFHGRSTGKVAGRTKHHNRKPSRATYPPYGNGDQQWVGVAWLLTPDSATGS